MTEEFPKVFDCGLPILAVAPEVSMLGFEADLRDDYVYEQGLLNHAESLAGPTVKPVFAYASFDQTYNREIGARLADLGVPCLNGAETVMTAIRHLQDWADHRRRARNARPEVPLAQPLGPQMDETKSLALLAGYGLPTAPSRVCEDTERVARAAPRISAFRWCRRPRRSASTTKAIWAAWF